MPYVILLLFAIAAYGQQDAVAVNTVDSRDGKVYKIVKIGKQIWMAENLNYNANNSKCYDNKPANCIKYGRLYDWETARRACPKGWHLPSYKELTHLMDFIGDTDETYERSSESTTGPKIKSSMIRGDYLTAGVKLKAKDGWVDPNKGKDIYGFSALPGGLYWAERGEFNAIGNWGLWWINDVCYDFESFDEVETFVCYMAMTHYANNVQSGGKFDKSDLLSVRCLKD